MNDVDYYMKLVSKYKLLTREEEIELAIRIKNGDKLAVQELACSSLRLVVKLAMRFAKWYPLMDLIANGNIGLMKAVAKFDHTKGFKFSSFAIWQIKRHIHEFMNNDSTIRIPERQLKKTGFIRPKITTINKEIVSALFDDEMQDDGIPDIGLLHSLLTTLDARKRKIVTDRYGLNSARKTCLTLAKEMSLSEERVRQLQIEAVADMRKLCELQTV